LIKNVKVTSCQDEFGNREILLQPILHHIQSMGKHIDGLGISYFSDKDAMDVYVGVYPIELGVKIPRSDFNDRLALKLKNSKSGQSP
jgi:hypothetical protein